MTVPTALVFLGLGILVAMSSSGDARMREPRTLDELRARAIAAQQLSARTSKMARDFTEEWQAAYKRSREVRPS